MRFSRLISASLLVAAVTVLGSCGETTTPTTPSATDPSLLGVREFTISPNPVSWSKQPEDTLPTDTKTVLIGGVIAVASYPTFGPPVYTSSVPIEASPTTIGAVPNNWLEFTYGASASSFSKAPLGWNVSFKLKPAAALLPIGSYTATIAVNVPAALNNPQMLRVTFNNCGNCLFVGDERLAALTSDDPVWNRSSVYNNNPEGAYPYDDWRVFVAPFSTVQVDMIGECDPSRPDVSHEDVYLYAWETDLEFYDRDDDGGACNNSVFWLTNSGPTQKEFLVRSTSYSSSSSYKYGAYRIVISLGDYGALRAADPSDKATPAKVRYRTTGAVKP
jgi:hypothetical protein